MEVEEAYNLVKRIKPDCKLLECLEFDDFFAFFMIPKNSNEEDVAGAYDIVNKKTGEIGVFSPVENLNLYMSAKETKWNGDI